MVLVGVASWLNVLVALLRGYFKVPLKDGVTLSWLSQSSAPLQEEPCACFTTLGLPTATTGDGEHRAVLIPLGRRRKALGPCTCLRLGLCASE